MDAFDVCTWNTHVTHLLAIPHQYQAVGHPAGIQDLRRSLLLSVTKLPWASLVCDTELHLSFASFFCEGNNSSTLKVAVLGLL